MPTSIVEIAMADGMAKGPDGWFQATQSVVSYDHARDALEGDVITPDFSDWVSASRRCRQSS